MHTGNARGNQSHPVNLCNHIGKRDQHRGAVVDFKLLRRVIFTCPAPISVMTKLPPERSRNRRFKFSECRKYCLASSTVPSRLPWLLEHFCAKGKENAVLERRFSPIVTILQHARDSARHLLRWQQRQWINARRTPFHAPVQMGPAGPSGRAHSSDDLPLPDHLAFFDQ